MTTEWRGQGGGRLGKKGAGGVWEVGEERAGSRRNRGELCNIVQYFAIKKMQRGGSQQIQGREPGLKVWDTGGLNHPCPPSTTDPGLMDLAA